MGGLLSDFQALGMGVFAIHVFAIHVFAAGALAGRPPSEHTRRTPFFPLTALRVAPRPTNLPLVVTHD
jgi:hypothetical protein